MSYTIRTAIMRWITFILGATILGFQVYKYLTGHLELNYEEGIVTITSVVLMSNPNILSNGLNRFFNSKFNGKNGS